tara:strand:- start:19590 stop:20564 length:975 start_codon:yes stop_codon:yes gene_type:complete
MASTYTTNTGIEKPGTGDQAGTWGTTTNTNFDIIDAALHGQAAITITGSQDLTTNDGSVSDGQKTVLVLSGTPGSTFELRVTPTDQKKFYTIRNETDAACRIIYKGNTYSTSNGVEIASGATQAVTGDGGGASSGKFKSLTPPTDLVNDASPQLSANLDVNGNSITSTSNGNVVISPNGTGDVQLDADTVRVGDNNADATITTNGTGDLTLSTNSGTNSGTIAIADGTNGNISVTPNGTGSVVLDGLSYPQADGTNGQYLQTDGSGNLSFSTVPISGSTFTLGSWTLSVVSNELVFSYNGTGVAKIKTTGEIVSADDITAEGTI